MINEDQNEEPGRDDERESDESAGTRRTAGTVLASIGAVVTLAMIPLPLASHYPLHHGPAVTQQSPARALGSLSGELPPHPETPGYSVGTQPWNTSGTATTWIGLY